MKAGISLLTMGAGNVIVLHETLESFRGVCDEVVYGDMLLFAEDREILRIYEKEFNMKIIPFHYDFIFEHGFSKLLNKLASHASNDMAIYMNTGEVIDENYGVNKIIKDNPDCNTLYFTHRTDPHRWYRLYNRHELEWSGILHEQLKGDYRPYHKPAFMMKDLPKDMHSTFKAKVLDIVKDFVYHTQYMRIVDEPSSLGETDPSWVKFATECYESYGYRMRQKGEIYEAFKSGDLHTFLSACYASKEISDFKFESNKGIEYQQDKKYLL